MIFQPQGYNISHINEQLGYKFPTTEVQYTPHKWLNQGMTSVLQCCLCSCWALQLANIQSIPWHVPSPAGVCSWQCFQLSGILARHFYLLRTVKVVFCRRRGWLVWLSNQLVIFPIITEVSLSLDIPITMLLTWVSHHQSADHISSYMQFFPSGSK